MENLESLIYPQRCLIRGEDDDQGDQQKKDERPAIFAIEKGA
jgi:hypothetical protein